MKYSVVTALFNGLSYTQTFLRSLDATLEGEDYELILVDDGSTDETREFLETLRARPNTKIFLNPENRGYARSNNFGASKAEGEFLLLLNNDLELLPGWLEPMQAAFQHSHDWMGHQRKTGLVGNIQRRMSDHKIDHAGVYLSIYSTPAHAYHGEEHAPKTDYSTRSAASAACWLIATDTFRKHGGFDERYINGMEDVDLCLQILESGSVPVIANRSTVLHAVSASRKESPHEEANYRKLWEKWRYPLMEFAPFDHARYLALRERERKPIRARARDWIIRTLARPYWEPLQDRSRPFMSAPTD